VEKARSLLEAEANLDEIEDGLHPSGFVPASASHSGFSPIGTGRGDPSGQPRGTASSVESTVAGPPGLPSGDRLVDSLQGALGAASRSEAGLGSLQRAIRDASRAFTASRQAQEALTEELRVMHRGLNELMSEKAAVERYAALLTQERDAALDAAEEARREAKREREFLLREQDRFIQLLLEEHEAELQQLRRSLNPRPIPGAEADASNIGTTGALSAVRVAVTDGAPPIAPTETTESAVAGCEDAVPATVPGIAPAFGEQPAEGRKSSPPGEFFSGAALARQALANAAGIEPPRTVPLPEEKAGEHEGQPEARAEDDRGQERAPTYPPAPAVLDLDSLAAEIDGNSERPPPIRRIGVAEPKIHLKPARVPTQLFDTLVSQVGDIDPNRKS
jgi:hypothetical protein